MINRFSICLPKIKLSERFEAAAPANYTPIYNGSQGQQMPVITNENENRIVLYQWGLIPYNSKDPLIGDKLINARARTLHIKSPFCDLLASKRCIIPADGFFVWDSSNGQHIPYRVELKSGQAFAIAGLWDEWKVEGEEESSIFKTFTIITTDANSVVSPFNDRMPAILAPSVEKKWLEDKVKPEKLSALLKPYEPEELKIFKVADFVNDTTVNNINVIKEENTNIPGETLSLFD